MSGTVKVYVESSDGNLVDSRMSQVQRVVIKQLPSVQDIQLWQEETGLDDASTAAELAAKLKIFYGQFPSSVPRKKLGDKDSLLMFEFPFGPKEVQYGDLALNYQEVRRPGRKALLRPTAPKNRTLRLSAVIADRRTRGLGSCEEQIRQLEALASDNYDLEFRHGYRTFPSRLRITSLGINSRERNLNGEITKAQIDVAFKEIKPLNVDIVQLAAILEEPEPLATVPGEEEEKEKVTPDAEQMSRGEDAFKEDDPYHGMEEYVLDRPDLPTADFALLNRYM